MFDVGQMHADLMSASGLYFQVEQREFIKTSDRAIESQRLSTVECDGHLHAAARVAANRRVDFSRILFYHTINHRGVPFRDRARFELLGQAEMRAVCLGRDDQSRCAHIQAVHYAGSRRTSAPWRLM